MSFIEKCKKPIPIGVQKFAYQCEDMALVPVHGAIDIRAFIPRNKGSEPYPNPEKETVDHYHLEIKRFTHNSLEILFTKKFKDGSEETYLTNASFSNFVNRIFEDQEANFFEREAPTRPAACT